MSWASKDNPGIYVFAPSPESYPWSMRAPSPTPRAHYVCRCGQTNAAVGEDAVKALISEYLTHMKATHPDLPEVPGGQAKRAA
ncbi:hypothetical protein ABH931_005538 [Streptacidiphilus sp. MAP12-33]|uniref:hypothetical protein n=1 Tax=Streptacidiphilus sp. MAP12-33 TaxID=3156266 RepID=UPI00351394A0